MNFKAKVIKWAGSSDLTKVVEFLTRSKSPVELENPNLQIATVTNQRDEVVGCLPFERVFLVSAGDVSQVTNPSEELAAGNAVAEALQRAAQSQGVGKVLFVLPHNYPPFPGERVVRVVEHQIQQTKPMLEVGCHTPSATVYLN